MRNILCAVIILFVVAASGATVATNSFNYQAVNNTAIVGLTNSAASVSIPSHTFLIQQTALGSTQRSNLLVEIQVSFDAVNWTTVTNYYPATTNATVATFVPNFSQLTAYVRPLVSTTNINPSVGVTTLRTQ